MAITSQTSSAKPVVRAAEPVQETLSAVHLAHLLKSYLEAHVSQLADLDSLLTLQELAKLVLVLVYNAIL